MITATRTDVNYDRSTKTYEARNGHLVATGDKRHCRLAALLADCPRIHTETVALIREAKGNESLIRRIVKAGFILRDGLLQPARGFQQQLPGEVAFCLSQTHEGKGYAITESFRRDGYFICDCYDWVKAPRLYLNGGPGQPACKHVLAHIISTKEKTHHDNF